MVKVITFFLIGIAILAVFGKLHLLRRRRPPGTVTCLDCGRPVIGKGPCDCGGRRGR